MVFGMTACSNSTEPDPANANEPTATEPPTDDAGSTAEEPTERVLRMDAMANAGYPAPYLASSKGSGYAVVQYIFDTLVWKDDTGFINYLTESYSVSDDNKTYTFKLRPDVTFNDGEPFTAEDVKFTFDYMTEHPYSWVSTASIKETRVVDDLTVEVELNDVYVAFIADVASNLPILPKHVYENIDDPTTCLLYTSLCRALQVCC